MNEQGHEEELARQGKALFDDSVERLDAATLSRLNQSRHEALAEVGQAGPVGHWSRWVPATGIAAAALIAVVLWQGMPTEAPAPAANSATDFEILLGEDSLEMLEDLEFYSWMGSTELETNGNVG